MAYICCYKYVKIMDELIEELEKLDTLDLWTTSKAVWLDDVITVIKKHYGKYEYDDDDE